MGMYLNPGNMAFARNIKKNYIDKTGIIEILNDTIGTSDNLTCVSRPRRFGKSFAANMLIAYYDHTCDSHDLFKPYHVSGSESYEEHINKYNVIALDITGFISSVKSVQGDIRDIPKLIQETLKKELAEEYPELGEITDFTMALKKYVELTGRMFIFVIDEWDALIREAKDDKLIQDTYLNLLRGLFKNNNFTPYAVAAAYMTGILPIKKDGTQSAISDFQEYSILNPGKFAKYTGFTENEVEMICERDSDAFQQAKMWYDGYQVGKEVSVYNPYSVMQAVKSGEYRSFWKYTSAADSLETYINMNFDGLQEDVARLINGEELDVSTDTFNNDLVSFRKKDDVLTLMIHLGYLTYNNETCQVRIPNEEVRSEFTKLIENAGMTKLAGLIQSSEKLLKDTIEGDSKAVEAAIGIIRESNYAPNFYNNEQALRYVIKFAYIVCVDKYMKIEELPSGKGIADVVYIPKKNRPDPALVIELKWDKTSDAAISQIKTKNYPAVLHEFEGDIILVGIDYNPDTKKHHCTIEHVSKGNS